MKTETEIEEQVSERPSKARIAHLLRCQNIRLDRVSAHLSNGKTNDGQREVAELKGLVEILRTELLRD